MKRRRFVWLAMLLTFAAGCNGSWSSGDRVLVGKYLYDSGVGRPKRYDVVVFRCPEDPQRGGPLDNFIKRLLGLGGETLAIFFGHLFVTTDWQPPADLDAEHAKDAPASADPLDLWQPKYMYRNDANARKLFREGPPAPEKEGGPKRRGFTILRKDPETMMALRRIVYDNDHQARDLREVHFPARWAAEKENAWSATGEGTGFETAGQGDAENWLVYRHIPRPLDWPDNGDPQVVAAIMRRYAKAGPLSQLITDFSGYNSYEKLRQERELGGNWVGDLMLDFDLTVDRAEGEFLVELARGVDRFQARWNLASGECSLWRLQDGKADPEKLAGPRATPLKAGPGTYHLRFANFDERLTVWVDRDLPFGNGVEYPRAWYFDAKQGAFVNVAPTAHDRKPANLGSKGAAVKVQHLQLWRNTYYTMSGPVGLPTTYDFPYPGALQNLPERLNNPVRPEDVQERRALVAAHWERFWSDEGEWGPLKKLDFATYYVQKGHYMCLGDNSPESHDSRAWGTVPERLMLGRALVVYYPFNRAGLIH